MKISKSKENGAPQPDIEMMMKIKTNTMKTVSI